MSEELVIRHCAPTLAGLKTGSLFSADYSSDEALRKELRALNRVLVPKGLRAIKLRDGRERALIYVYRPSMLSRDLNNEDAKTLLQSLGYQNLKSDACLSLLMKKLRENQEFPHEIGLFLSYPPEDVQGFMEHKAAGSKVTGCWKVYGDVDRAQKTFRKYKRCTEVYCKLWRKGTSIDRLTVAG